MPEIQRVIKVYNHRKSDRLIGYQLVMDNQTRPYVCADWITNGNHSHYVKLLKSYIEKHPELFILGLVLFFPQISVPLFGKFMIFRGFGL